MYEGNNHRSPSGGTRRAVSLGGGIRGAGRYEPPRRRSGGTGGGFGGGSRGRSGGTGAFAGGRQRNQGGRGRGGESIDVSRFVNKSVVIEEVKTYIPTHQFADFAIEDSLKKNIEHKGYKIPTAIQDRAIPDVLQGRDVIGIANTGEGKTAAFLIPLINKMIKDPTAKVLVMVPTRELALQIDEEFMGFARTLQIYSVLLVGGASIGMQIERLRRKVRMVIGTPGRIKDLIERRELDLSGFHNLVLDEADRMLDMGFLPDIKAIIANLPRDRHTMYFSATFSREIETLASTLLREPIKISVKTHDTSKNVEQDVIRVKSREEKFGQLCGLLGQKGFGKVLIFGKTKHGVEKLGMMLNKEGFKTTSIHGNKSQPQRQQALKAFKDEKVQVMVATDVAARGLDIPNVTHVINYEVPQTYDDYVHRIGRTGRAGKKGVALTFVGGN
jgi:superfamily II DNA/RNA helicase